MWKKAAKSPTDLDEAMQAARKKMQAVIMLEEVSKPARKRRKRFAMSTVSSMRSLDGPAAGTVRPTRLPLDALPLQCLWIKTV